MDQTIAAPQVRVKIDVPKYSGKEGENLAHWLLAVETAGHAQLITDSRTQVMFAISHLTGKAREWSLSQLMLNQDAFESWTRFKTQLRRTFYPPDAEQRLRARLLNCRQGNRSLYDYVQELRFLNASMETDPLSEGTKVTIFMEGLKQGPARLQLFRDTPPTFEAAIAVAMREEFSHKGASGHHRITIASNDDGATPMDLSNAESARSLNCFRCGRNGHLRRDCRVRMPDNRSGNTPPRGDRPHSMGNSHNRQRFGNNQQRRVLSPSGRRPQGNGRSQ